MSACLLLQLILPMLLQAFGTIGPVETAYFRETGKQVLLSEQDLMDCGWYLNNKACFGGYQVYNACVSLSALIFCMLLTCTIALSLAVPQQQGLLWGIPGNMASMCIITHHVLLTSDLCQCTLIHH